MGVVFVELELLVCHVFSFWAKQASTNKVEIEGSCDEVQPVAETLFLYAV